MSSDLSNSAADSYWSEEASWPAIRNDHYCSQEVCRHAVLDLSPYEISDSEDGQQWSGSLHHTLPPSVRTTQQLKIARSTIAQLTQQTFRLRKELDDLHTSSAAHYFDLEERLATHVARYDELSEQHHQLALKYDHILNIMVNMCEKLDVHAEKLVELDDWRGMQPQIMNFGYPSPMHTVDIVHETADILLGMREQGVEPMSTPSPPSTPSASAESAKECRLVLRLPLRPAVDKGETERADSVYGSSGEKGKMDVKLVSKKRVRKRKSVDDGPTRIVKRAKKCHV